MTREGKSLFLLALTYILYAASILLSQGNFIFPFPLNGFAFFVVALQLAYWNKDEFIRSVIIVLIGFSSLIGSPPFWEIWSNNEFLSLLEELGFYSFIFLTHSALILLFLILSIAKENDRIIRSLSLTTIVGIILGTILGSYLVLSLSFLLIAITFILKRQMKGLNWIWTYLLFFSLINFISFEL